MRNGSFTQKLYLKQSQGASKDSNLVDGSFNSGIPIDTDGFTYGYVFFRQKRDALVKRGFFQVWSTIFTFRNR
jgi:hypothetical protein